MILVAGAGCAGLSLVVHLLEAGYEEPIAIFDPRTTFERDRTFCFFDVAPHPFSALATQRYDRALIANERRAVEVPLAIPYACLPGDVFYAEALRRLRAAPNVELHLGEKVDQIEDHGDHVVMNGHRGAMAFDARRILPEIPRREITLHQQFLGWFVRTSAPAFEPGRATLMDFRVPQSHGIHFVYVLPFSTREALVEDTYFTREPIAEGLMVQQLQKSLGRQRYEITARERGSIPMTTARLPQRISPRVVRIGVAGGLARPSTGYAFLAIQRQSKELARRIVAGPLPIEPPRPYSRRAEMLDGVFLSFLARHPERAPELFAEMFARLPSEVIARFLCDACLPLEEVRVMHALSAFPLAWEAIRAPKRWLPAFFSP